VLAKGKTDTGRIWVYVRDDKPFGGPAPPAAVFHYSRDRAGAHPQAHLAGYNGNFRPRPIAAMASLRARPQARSDPGSCVLGPRPAALRDGGSGRECASQGSRQEAAVISPLALEGARSAPTREFSPHPIRR
jgi:transposase